MPHNHLTTSLPALERSHFGRQISLISIFWTRANITFSGILDDYSRYILSWKLTSTMSANNVEDKPTLALDKTGLDSGPVELRPRLLSDNGSCFLSKDLKDFLDHKRIDHTRCGYAPHGHDPGQYRTQSSLDEENRQSAELLSA